MSQLPDDAKAAFARARSVYSPSPEQLARLRARITATLTDTASSAPQQPADLPMRAAPRLPSWHAAGPWLAGTVLLGALGAALYLGLRSEHVAPQQRSSAAAPVGTPGELAVSPEDAPLRPARAAGQHGARPVEAVAPPQARLQDPAGDVRAPPTTALTEGRSPSAARSRARGAISTATAAADTAPAQIDAPADSQQPLSAQAPAVPLPPADTGAPAHSVARIAAPVPAADGLREEVALLRAARRALEQGDAAGADAALAQHRRRFGAGQLRVERVALEVWSGCARGDGAAARASFRELSLLSPTPGLSAGIRDRCGELLR